MGKGFLKLVDVRTEEMGADMMTKAVGPAVLGVNMKLIGMFKSGYVVDMKRLVHFRLGGCVRIRVTG